MGGFQTAVRCSCPAIDLMVWGLAMATAASSSSAAAAEQLRTTLAKLQTPESFGRSLLEAILTQASGGKGGPDNPIFLKARVKVSVEGSRVCVSVTVETDSGDEYSFEFCYRTDD